MTVISKRVSPEFQPIADEVKALVDHIDHDSILVAEIPALCTTAFNQIRATVAKTSNNKDRGFLFQQLGRLERVAKSNFIIRQGLKFREMTLSEFESSRRSTN